MSDDLVLKCTGLSKSYVRGTPVLKDFDFEIKSGKIYGLLGPNGCGKSTFLKLVAGLLVPDSGTIEICGEPRSEESNSLISYLPERTYFAPRMKVSELLDYFVDFYSDFSREVAERMLKDLGIPTTARLRELSKGMKEKVQLIMVMSRRAKLYMLDEPIGGVDPASREYILNTIIGNYSPEASVIITTHLITDIEPVLDEFAFMGYGGEILRMGNADMIREHTGMSLDELFKEVFRCYVRH
ncbi:MAG: ABC transporter ATP-binding protein [Clostridia bacterium]|nr:ABC transporter ATP-binding protein [Clostridia bacterium]